MSYKIRNLHTEEDIPPRAFDVEIIDDHVLIKYQVLDKDSKKRYETIPWEDVKYQVEIALQMYKGA